MEENKQQIKSNIDNQKQKVLSDREQARLRLPVFFGSFDSSFHAFIEQLMNARDELFNHNNGGEIRITLDDDLKTVTVQDNGRGILIHGIDEDTNRPNYELVFETLFSGGNYDNAYSDDLIESIGGNGVGNSTTAYTSLYFQATEFKNNKAYQITYHDGCTKKEYKEFDSENFEHGTRITYMLDDNVYTTNVYNPQDMINQIKRVSSTSNNIKYYFTHNGETKEFLFDSYEEYVNDININKLTNNIHFPIKNYEIKSKKDGKEFLEKDRIELIISLSTEPVQETYLNGGYLPEQGTFYKGIIEGIRKYLQKDIKDKKIKLTDNDIIMSFNVYGVMGSNNPVYSNQTKRASSNDAYKKLASQYIIENMEVFKKENPNTYKQIIEHVSKINGLNVKSEDSIKKLKEKLTSKSSTFIDRVENFSDCRVHGEEAELFITEGLSGKSAVVSARNAENQAVLPAKGKFLSTLKANVEQIANNQVIMNLVKVLGCGCNLKDKKGKQIMNFNMDDLKYGKIILAVDRDPDGGSISSLALTAIYVLMPELLVQGKVYLAKTPLYELTEAKTKKRIYAYSDLEKEEIIKNKNIVKIRRNKGLGEVNSDVLEETMTNPKTRVIEKITIDDYERMEKYFNKWMGSDPTERADYISKNLYKFATDLD